MRIEAYNQVAQLYQTSNTKGAAAASGVAKSARDQVQISSTGTDLQTAKTAVSEASDIREDLVASVKEKLNSGTYEVNTEDFADKLLSQFNSIF